MDLNAIKLNFNTYDFFHHKTTGAACSLKAIDTMGSSSGKPDAIKSAIGQYVEKIMNFKGDGARAGKFRLEPDMIDRRTIELAVREHLTPEQWKAVKEAADDARLNRVILNTWIVR